MLTKDVFRKFEHSVLVFVSNFDIRISNLPNGHIGFWLSRVSDADGRIQYTRSP